jgi:CubicO group peptidase (beta-lactamase class C family)
MLAAILGTPLTNAPGAVYEYTDLGYILLGEAAARSCGKPLESLIRSHVTDLIGADRVRLPPASDTQARIAPTANCPMRPGEVLRGVVHDANAHAYGGIAGHAGLFGDADGLALFGSALAGDGSVLGARLLGGQALRLARTNQLSPDAGGHTIGWFCSPNPMCPFGELGREDAFGHTGFTGTMMVCEPSTGVVVVLLTNRVVSPADDTSIKRVRRRVLSAVASAASG